MVGIHLHFSPWGKTFASVLSASVRQGTGVATSREMFHGIVSNGSENNVRLMMSSIE